MTTATPPPPLTALPASAIEARSSAADAAGGAAPAAAGADGSVTAATAAAASSSPDSSSPPSPLGQVIASLFGDLLSELVLDACVSVHREAHTRAWNLGPTADVDVFGLPNVKKVPEKSFKCESCGQKTGSSKYAAHLERCTGKGGRTSRRAKLPHHGHSASGSGLGLGMGAQSYSAAASATPALPALATRDDDVEVIAASRGGIVPGAPKPRPASAAAGLTRADADSPTGAGVGGGYSYARSATPLLAVHGVPSPASTLGNGSGSSSAYRSSVSAASPFAAVGGGVDGSGYSASPYGGGPSPYSAATGDSSTGSPGGAFSAAGVDQWPDGEPIMGLAGQKRRADDALAAKAPPEKKRRNARVDEYWTDPLPAELPTQLSLGGLPYVVDAADGALGTAPTAPQLAEMLSRICGVPSAATHKMCSNKPACTMHPEEDRARLRAAVLDGSATVRFKKVKATAIKKRAAGANGAHAGLAAMG